MMKNIHHTLGFSVGGRGILEKWKYKRPIKIGKNGIVSELVLSIILSFVLLSSSFFFHEAYSDGFNFEDISNLSDTDSVFSQLPQIAVVDSNVYVVWEEQSATGADIFFIASTNSGETFSEPVNLSDTDLGYSQLPQIAAVDSNVYVVWQDDALGQYDIFFIASTNSGETFSEPVNLSDTDLGYSINAQIVTAGSNVYVVWEEETDIFFRVIAGDGETFSEPINLSFTDSFSLNPQIAAMDSNVFVVWEEENPSEPDIFFIASTDGGVSFEPYVNLSSSDEVTSLAPQIAAADSNVYVVWQDYATGEAEIFFTGSSNEGQDFDEPVPVSKVESGRVSESPQIAVMDSNVYVVWQDNDFISESDIFFIASSNDGQDFGEPVNLSMNEGFSLFPQLDTSGQNINIVWEDYAAGQKEVFFVASTNAGSSFSTIFQVSDINDDSGTPQIAVQGSNCHIVWEDSSLGIPEIFYRGCIEVPTEINFDFSPYKLSDTAIITIIDIASAGLGSIIADVSTTSGGSLPSFELSESDTDTGVFTGQLTFTSGESSGTEIHAEPGDLIKVTLEDVSNSASIYPVIVEFENPWYSISESAVVKVTDQNANKKIDEEEEISITITSSANSDVIPLTLIETGPDTGIFENKDLISIQVALTDIITATYFGESDSFYVTTGSGPGKGGGGPVRPGLVLNAILELSGGNSASKSQPSFGTSSFATFSGGEEGFGGILSDNDAKTVEQTKTVKVGEKAVLRFDYTEGGGIGKIEHIGLYMNVRDGQKRQDSDAYIYYDPLKSPQVTVHDPNGIFSEVKVDLLPKDATNFVFKVEVTFAKPMAKSDLILEGWNTQKWSSLTKISNAIEVQSSGILQETASEPIVDTFVEDVTNDHVIPVWIKTNANWWSDDTIDNDTFVSGIEYLVNEGIIKVTLPSTTGAASVSEIQPWIKNTAGWWADDMISDNEFLTAIEWLISNDIIQVV